MHFKLQHYAEAEQHFRSCLELDPEHLSAFNGLGVLFASTNRPDLAELHFKYHKLTMEKGWKHERFALAASDRMRIPLCA